MISSSFYNKKKNMNDIQCYKLLLKVEFDIVLESKDINFQEYYEHFIEFKKHYNLKKQIEKDIVTSESDLNIFKDYTLEDIKIAMNLKKSDAEKISLLFTILGVVSNDKDCKIVDLFCKKAHYYSDSKLFYTRLNNVLKRYSSENIMKIIKRHNLDISELLFK